MYFHCKHGFVEADRWDGTPLSEPDHQAEITKLHKRRKGPVMVLRSRNKATLEGLVAQFKGKSKRPVFESPKGWDYPYRVYLTLFDFGAVLSHVIADIDYRNFKSWTSMNAPGEVKLAHDIWHVAHDAAKPARPWGYSGGGIADELNKLPHDFDEERG